MTVYHWNGPGNSVSYVLCGIVYDRRKSETPTELVHAICITRYGESVNYMRYMVMFIQFYSPMAGRLQNNKPPYQLWLSTTV